MTVVSLADLKYDGTYGVSDPQHLQSSGELKRFQILGLDADCAHSILTRLSLGDATDLLEELEMHNGRISSKTVATVFSHYPYFTRAQPDGAVHTHYETPLYWHEQMEYVLPDSTPFLDNSLHQLYQDVLDTEQEPEYFNLSRQHLEVLLPLHPVFGLA